MFILFLFKTIFIGLSFIAFCIGFVSFIYKAINHIEEHPSKAKEKIRFIIYGVCAMHIVLLFRGFRILLVLFSIGCQLLFLNLLDGYPDIETSGAGFIIAVSATFVNHMFFLGSMLKRKIGLIEIFFYFFIIVWSVPFSFFLSLTANDDTVTIPGAKKPIRRTFAGKILDSLLSRQSLWEDR